MYARTPEAAEMRQETTRKAMEKKIGGCREWVEGKANTCGAPAEYVLWGKLLPAEALGPRCYDHAAEHIGHVGLQHGTTWALIHLGDLAKAIDDAHLEALS